jgi:hypothetical protein
VIPAQIQNLPFDAAVSSVPLYTVQFIHAESPYKGKRNEEGDYEQKNAKIHLSAGYADTELKRKNEKEHSTENKCRKNMV